MSGIITPSHGIVIPSHGIPDINPAGIFLFEELGPIDSKLS